MEATPERLDCLRTVLHGGGSLNHDAAQLAPFCDDASTLTKPDVFNQCHDAGWLRSLHDDRTGNSTVYLTQEGRAVLVAQQQSFIGRLFVGTD
jgi:hypothetical protein